MSEEYQEQQIHKLRELGKDHAKAKGQVTLLDHGRKILLAKLMKEHMINSNTGKLDSVASQEREGRSDPRYKEHIKAYGSNNHLRLTGLHETQHIDEFSWGDSDRGASVRVPVHTINNNYNGYLEDRRPGSNADPYKIVGALVKTLQLCHR